MKMVYMLLFVLGFFTFGIKGHAQESSPGEVAPEKDPVCNKKDTPRTEETVVLGPDGKPVGAQ